MSTRNLLINPCWRAKDLGQPLPDSPHAVSVALPRWEDVVGYDTVTENGGYVKIVPYVEGKSTSGIVNSILEQS